MRTALKEKRTMRKKRKKETKGHIILNLQQVALPKYIIMLLQSHTHWLYHSWPSVMARSKSMPQSSGRLDDLDPLIALTADDVFVYVEPVSYRINSQSSFELQRRNTKFKLGHKIGTVP